MEDTVTITKKEYDRLVSRDEDLGWLEAAGVDNWSGYSYAWELKEQEEQKNKTK